MKKVKFEANYIMFEINKDEEYRMIAIADDEFNQENYVVFQKAFEFDEHDEELGMDGYYFEVNNQMYSGYKSCRSVRLSENSLEIEIDHKKIDDISFVKIDVSEVLISEEMLAQFFEILGKVLTVVRQ